MNRSAGILMHITSLPSNYGIGTLGEEAYKFADFLKSAGQTYWQILPIGPTSYGDSPYQSFSSYAGNPYLIDLDLLCNDDLLLKKELESLNWCEDETIVSYQKVYDFKFNALKKAYDRFKNKNQFKYAFQLFQDREESWLDDYAIYMSVREHFNMKSWDEWPDLGIKFRHKDSIIYYKKLLNDRIGFWKFLQFIFYRQWENLKRYVNLLGISFIGDMPIYVALDSADTWSHPDVFWLDKDAKPVCVAGCPPDFFSEEGQLWGNPLYNWDFLKSTKYEWLIERIGKASKLFDVTRIDHFRAFDSYYAIPGSAENAVHGEWKKGPGMDFFYAMKEKLGDIPIIAEDLGFFTPSVITLLKDSGYPGMKVLQFAFGSDADNDHLPHKYDKNSVVYTGTHDNETIMGWWENCPLKDKSYAHEYAALNETEGYNWGFIRLAYSSISNLAIIQMQDFLGLDNRARMNIPSTFGGNWAWRVKRNALNKQLAIKINSLTQIYGRVGKGFSMKNDLMENLHLTAKNDYCKDLNDLTTGQLHDVLGKVIMGFISEDWRKSSEKHEKSRRAYYFSAEFLMGRMIYNNLYSLGILDEAKKILQEHGLDLNVFEDIEDAALGNGGLGRLAACFLDSAVTHEIPLDGYGIRYKYGIFKQKIEDGFQVEYADNWQYLGDPWSVRKEEDAVEVAFADQTVRAVPYDMAIIGYKTKNINTLRLWQSEPINEFDFVKFNDQWYSDSVSEKNSAEDISRVLYPNDSTIAGKILRLKQQYFFCSASIQDIIKKYKKSNGNDFSRFADHCAIQLNDTHPVISIPELIRLLDLEGISFNDAFDIAQKIFAYTNHTIMSEALEKWDVSLIYASIPEVYDVITRINSKLVDELTSNKFNHHVLLEKDDTHGIDLPTDEEGRRLLQDENDVLSRFDNMKIIYNDQVHMANLAVYASSYTNGVARLHTDILKNDLLKNWYKLYPERFQNKTNGITQRRWLGLCNNEFSELITECIGEGWIKDLSQITKLKEFIKDEKVVKKFNLVKDIKKKQLSEYIFKIDNIEINPEFIFDIQVKRLHEYKRQLLNAFSIMAIYFRLKDGSLKDFNPTVFIFGAKAAPGYKRAKAIIKYINEVANLVNNDPDVNDKIKVVFISNYNCSYAEKIVVAADISEQISTAGTEASGTGNMKFMLNGAVTLGTYDGANVEIVEQAGEDNNYIFGARVENINHIKNYYNPKEIYQNNLEIKRVVDTLIDGSFDDGGYEGEGSFVELYHSLLNGTSWHQADNYFLLYDLNAYVDTKLRANRDYSDRILFGRKCLENTAGAGMFSSDRTIKQYAKELWDLK